MKNYDYILKGFFGKARSQPPLLDIDDARKLVAASDRTGGVRPRSNPSVLRTLVVGLAAIGLFMWFSSDVYQTDVDSSEAAGTSRVAGHLGTGHGMFGHSLNTTGEETGLFSADSTYDDDSPASSNRTKEKDRRTRVNSPQSDLLANNRRGASIRNGSRAINGSASSSEAITRSDQANTVTTVPDESTLSTQSDDADNLHRDGSGGSLDYSDAYAATTSTQSTIHASVVEPMSLGYEVAIPEMIAVAQTSSSPLDGQIVVTNLEELNSSVEDYNPMITADGRTLYFVSERDGGVGDHDYWMATKKERDEVSFSPPTNLGSSINTPKSEGGATISADGLTMYYTACDRPDRVGDCDIYEAKLTENGWETVRNLREINTAEWDASPSISADGRVLYFVSNRTGCLGGYDDVDIFYSRKQTDGTWSEPKNIGRPINTTKREDSPFKVPGSNALYFSSEGHGGFGNLDFLVSYQNENGEWQNPENLGKTFNTSADERFIALPTAQDIIYFGSTVGDGNLDLYMARRETRGTSVVISGRVKKQHTDEWDQADMLFVDAMSGEVLSKVETNRQTGEYSFVLSDVTSQRTIDVYGLSDRVGEFRSRFTIGPVNQYTEYECNFLYGIPTHDLPDWATPRLTLDQVGSRLYLIDRFDSEFADLRFRDSWNHLLGGASLRRIDNPLGMYTIELNVPNGELLLARSGQRSALLKVGEEIISPSGSAD